MSCRGGISCANKSIVSPFVDFEDRTRIVLFPSKLQKEMVSHFSVSARKEVIVLISVTMVAKRHLTKKATHA